MTALEIVGVVALYLVGLVASFYVPVLTTLAFYKGDGLVAMAISLRSGAVCLFLYVVGSAIFLAID